MNRVLKANLSSGTRINRFFRHSLAFSVIAYTFISAVFLWGSDSYGQSLPDLTFSVSTADKKTDVAVQWVTAGGGILAYGTGLHVDFAPEDDPFSSLSQLSFDGVISEGLILGKYALLSQEGLGLRIIDLSVPSNPLDLGIYPLSGTAFHLASWGNLLFVSGVDPGIHIFELSFSTEQNPPLKLIDREVLPVTDPITALTASEWKIYAATGKEIKVYDISDSFLPQEMDSLSVSLPARSIAINGNDLYVAAGSEGLHVLGLSTPGNIRSRVTHAVQSESLSLAGRLVYLAAGDNGLHLLKAEPIAAATFDVQVAPYGNPSFVPSIVNINTGDAVKWTWVASGHSTTSGSNCTFNGPGPNTWDSGLLNSGATFQFTFDTAGSFPYFCSRHCNIGLVNVTAPICSYSILPTSNTLGPATGSGSVAVTAGSTCSWTASTNPGSWDWIGISSGTSGIGNGTVNYFLLPNNTGSTRTGTLTMAGQTFTITQTACAYSILPPSNTLGPPAGSGSVAVTAGPTCSWTASTNAGSWHWIGISSGTSGIGNGTVNYFLLANNTGVTRMGTLTIAGQTFAITQQAACTYSILPISNTLGPTAGSGSVSVTADPNCSWTASTNAGSWDWIGISSGASGIGNGTVDYFLLANNTGITRMGTLAIAGQTLAITQTAK